MRYSVFKDFDEFAASIHGIDSQTMMFRNASHRQWTIKSIELGKIEIQVGRLGSGNIARGQMRPDGCMLYLPLTENIKYVANGVEMGQGTTAILEPGCEFCISTDVDHDWCAVFVPNELLADRTAFEPDDRFQRQCWVTPPKPEFSKQLLALSRNLIATATLYPDFEASPAATKAADEVFQIASSLIQFPIEENTMDEGRPKISRIEIIQKTMDWIDRNSDANIRVNDLSTAAGVSERTLRNTFNEYFGIGPNRYLQLRQLHRIHQALITSDPDATTVGQVMANHGEWAFSRFAARYRKHFGERPLETLRSSSASLIPKQ